MSRTDSYAHFDDPYNYFRRLESYSSSRPRSFSRPSTYVGERTPSSSPIKQLLYLDSPERSAQRSAQRSELSTPHTAPTRPPRPRRQSQTLSQAEWEAKYAAGCRLPIPPLPRQTELGSRVEGNTHTESVLDSYVDSEAAFNNSYVASDVHSMPDGFFTTQTRSHEDSERLTTYRDRDRDDDEKSPQRARHVDDREYRQYTNLHDDDEPKKRGCWPWSRRMKILIGFSVVFLLANAIIAGVVTHLRSSSFSYTASNAHVTNATAFESGGATRANPNITSDGIGKGLDQYTYYTGGPQDFPLSSAWVSFDDMWTANLPAIKKSCSVLGYGDDNTDEDNQDIYNSIQNRANASLVDHRFILAVMMQESHGCVHIPPSSSHSGVSNPGLMQSHNGHGFSSSHASLSILAMIQDGTQGTNDGHGLVQNLNIYGDPYSAARGYNSGYIAASGDLSDAAGATACYVSDIANRLTGWVNAKSTCPGDDEG